MLETSIAFIIFNRPDLTQIVFDKIREVQPKKLFVIADGPRNPEEWKKCQAARDVINQVNWDCKIFRNYSDVNLGCRDRVSSGITWVFEHVEEAIILEDDCVPTPSFFFFCQTLLEHYHDDERIMVISGNNFQNGINRTKYSYYFSRYNHCWGWATWKRAWQYWSFDREKWLEFKQENLLEQLFEESIEAKHWQQIFDRLFLKGEPDSWAYVWTFSCWANSGLSILPNRNLVSNVGFRADATHTRTSDNTIANLSTQDIWEIQHPPFIVRNKQADTYTFNRNFGGEILRQKQSLVGYLFWVTSRLFYFLIRPQKLLSKVGKNFF